MSFLGKANVCANGHSKLWQLFLVIQSDILIVSHSLAQLFSSVQFSGSALHQFEQLSHLQQSQVPFHFLLPDVVIAKDTMPSHCTFYFQGSQLPLSVCGSWSVLYVRLTLSCKNFRQLAWCCVEGLFHYLVRWLPWIWITALLKLMYVIKMVQFLFFFPDRTTRYWVWPTSTILLLFQHTFPTNSVWRPIICHGDGCFQSGIFLTLLKQHLNFRVYERWICWFVVYHAALALLHLGKSTTPRCLGVDCVQPSLDVSGRLCLVFCVSTSGSVQVYVATCHWSIQTLIPVVPCWMETPWLPRVINIL